MAKLDYKQMIKTKLALLLEPILKYEHKLQEKLRNVLGELKFVELDSNFLNILDEWTLPLETLLFRKACNVQNITSSRYEYANILNIFNPEHEAYRETQSTLYIDADKFYNILSELISLIPEPEKNPSLMYNLVYQFLDYVYGVSASRSIPYDKFFPTYTVLDYSYARVTVSNMFLHILTSKLGSEDKVRPQGYLAYIDIPGIQDIVSSARKVVDYWAGSWLVSYLTFSIVKPLIDVLGFDIMLIPTARHNLMCRQWLFKKISDLKREKEKNIVDVVKKHFDVKLAEMLLIGEPHPTMPGTVTIIIPKVELNTEGLPEGVAQSVRRVSSRLQDKQTLRELLYEQYRETWRDIVEKLASLSQSGNKVQQFIGKLVEERKDFLKEDYLAAPRIVIVDLERVYDKLRREIEEESKYRDLINVCIQDFDEETCSVVEKKLMYYLLFSKILHEEIVRTRFHECFTIPVSNRYLEYTQRKYEESRDIKSNEENKRWRYCTVCGLRPALVELPREIDQYLKSVNKCLDIVKHFKPGESLCGICLVKRALRFILDKLDIWLERDAMLIESVEDIANLYIRNKIRELHEHDIRGSRELVSSICDQIQRECRKLEREIVPEEIVRAHLLQELRNLVCSCISKQYSQRGELCEPFHLSEVADTIEILSATRHAAFKRVGIDYIKQRISSELRRRVCSKLNEWFSKLPEDVQSKLRDLKLFLIDRPQVRVYYAIIKGDGDSVGELLIGNLRLRPEDYYKCIHEKVSKYISDLRVRELHESVCKVVSEICRKLSVTILLSPIYQTCLSSTMMLIATKDVLAVSSRRLGVVVYAGGDDVVVLAPVETMLDVVNITRKNYWALDEPEGSWYFHRIGSSIVPAPVAYGRSYGVRVAHIMDPLQLEIRICTRLLEEYAKESKWKVVNCTAEHSKDTLALSYGRTTLGEDIEIAKIPLSLDCYVKVGEIVELLGTLWRYILSGDISHNMPRDYTEYHAHAVKLCILKGYETTVRDIVKTFIERNVQAENAEKLIENIVRMFDKISPVIEGDSSPLIEHVVNAIKMLSLLPR